MSDLVIKSLPFPEATAHIDALSALLHDCVHNGASIGFIEPFPMEESLAFWRDKVLPKLENGSCTLFVAEVGGQLAGTVQLDIGTMPNQAHRGEVCKLMVHPDFRGQGIARGLMTTLEKAARAKGRTLITLDTRTGDKAEPLYRSLGYETAGTIPDYARDVSSDRLDATTFMYKRL